jgi:hypothetical protein
MVIKADKALFPNENGLLESTGEASYPKITPKLSSGIAGPLNRKIIGLSAAWEFVMPIRMCYGNYLRWAIYR